jgi:phosphatidylglycerol:prolipoprotein diacylglycerol transferase
VVFEAFQIGPFLFRSHTFFLLIGIWLSTELFLRLAVSEGLQLTHFLRRSWIYLLAFLVGGRIFSVLVLYRVYLQDPSRVFVFWDGNFSFLGGCAGLGIALFFVTLKQRSTFLQWLDALLPAVTLGLTFDWLGRFFGNFAYGKPTDVFWGVTVKSMGVRYTVPIHPVQLYYAAFFALMTLLLLKVRKRHQNRRAGFVTLLGIVFSALGTIFLEFLRGDFSVTIFAKMSDFLFLAALFVSFGTVAVLEQKLSQRYSLMNSIVMASGTVAYLLFRPWISVASVEWRFSQFLAVLAILGTVVYVTVHRWKYPHL